MSDPTDPADSSADPNDRRYELIAAAVAGELTSSERTELAALTRQDPSIQSEIAELRELVERMAGEAEEWDASAPSAGLRDRVLAIELGAGTANAGAPATGAAAGDGAGSAGAPTGAGAYVPPAPLAPLAPLAPTPSMQKARARWLFPVAAAACLLVGVGVGAAVTSAATAPAAPIAGAPGTLGAIEQVRFGSEPAGVEVDGSLVAHTWGTETILEIDGLTPGASYTVVVVGLNGERVEAGTFLGSTVTIDCRMNAALLRPDAAAVEIDDGAGTVVASALLPEATG